MMSFHEPMQFKSLKAGEPGIYSPTPPENVRHHHVAVRQPHLARNC